MLLVAFLVFAYIAPWGVRNNSGNIVFLSIVKSYSPPTAPFYFVSSCAWPLSLSHSYFERAPWHPSSLDSLIQKLFGHNSLCRTDSKGWVSSRNWPQFWPYLLPGIAPVRNGCRLCSLKSQYLPNQLQRVYSVWLWVSQRSLLIPLESPCQQSNPSSVVLKAISYCPWALRLRCTGAMNVRVGGGPWRKVWVWEQKKI